MKPGDIIVRSAGNRPLQVMSVFGPKIRAAYCGQFFQQRVDAAAKLRQIKEKMK